jgi:hypothetical protein
LKKSSERQLNHAERAKCPKYVSGNSLKGSNIKKEEKKKNPCGREKGCGWGRETTHFFYLALSSSVKESIQLFAKIVFALSFSPL